MDMERSTVVGETARARSGKRKDVKAALEDLLDRAGLNDIVVTMVCLPKSSAGDHKLMEELRGRGFSIMNDSGWSAYPNTVWAGYEDFAPDAYAESGWFTLTAPSTISALRYEGGVLSVEFAGGVVYNYLGVTLAEVKSLVEADDKPGQLRDISAIHPYRPEPNTDDQTVVQVEFEDGDDISAAWPEAWQVLTRDADVDFGLIACSDAALAATIGVSGLAPNADLMIDAGLPANTIQLTGRPVSERGPKEQAI